MKIYEMLTNLIEEVYSGWINDQNKIFKSDTNRDHLEMIEYLGFASLERAFEDGWVRIIWGHNGWFLEGTPKSIKRAFGKIAKDFFTQAKESSNFTLHLDLLSDPMDRYTNITSEYFIMPKDKIKLLQFIKGI